MRRVSMYSLDPVSSVGFWVFSAEKMKCKHSHCLMFPQEESWGWQAGGHRGRDTSLWLGSNPSCCLCQAVWPLVAMLPKPDIIQAVQMNVITLTVNWWLCAGVLLGGGSSVPKLCWLAQQQQKSKPSCVYSQHHCLHCNWKWFLPCIPNAVGIHKQFVCLVLYHVNARLVTIIKLIFAFIKVLNILFLTVNFRLINLTFIFSPLYPWNIYCCHIFYLVMSIN